MKQKLLAGVFSLFVASLHTVPAAAADVYPHISYSGSFRTIVIEGNIEPGDFEMFVRIIKENQGRVSGVHLFSPGGDFYEAMKIGRAMRTLELSSMVPMRSASGRPECPDLGILPKPKDPANCTAASAAFFIHIGGVNRGGSFIAVHRPYFGKGKFGELTPADAKKAFDALQDAASRYMEDMGVPQHVQDDVLGTPSDKALILNERTVETHFRGALPYRHEWIRNRCSTITDQEGNRLTDYSRRLQRVKNASDIDLSKSELTDMTTLQRKKSDELSCAVAAQKQSLLDAYEKYFGTKATDFSGYDFSKWAEATKYLGRRFYELLGEERFEESKFMSTTSLKRAATANAPAINLIDSRSSPKVVSSIYLISMPNPSPEFTQHLVQSIENAWGKRSGGSGISDWWWDKKDFSAKLLSESASDGEHFLRLSIDSE